MIAADDIDQLLLSFSDTDWQKVAKIIGNTLKALEHRGVQMHVSVTDQVDARMAALAGSGQLEAQGNIKRWGYSEVRFPGGRTAAAK
jgi:Protein of unknown function